MSKEQGDIGELEFILAAKKRGLSVLMPYSSICKYDLAVDNGSTLIRIQVKTVAAFDTKRGKRMPDTYRVSTGTGKSSKHIYDENDFDYFAALIIPLNTFYIIPIKEICSKTTRLYPENPEHRLHKYKDNWQQLLPKGANDVINAHPQEAIPSYEVHIGACEAYLS